MAKVTSDLMNKVYNGGFPPEFRISMSKETIALVRDYAYEARKQKAKLAGKIYVKLKYEIFLQ